MRISVALLTFASFLVVTSTSAAPLPSRSLTSDNSLSARSSEPGYSDIIARAAVVTLAGLEDEKYKLEMEEQGLERDIKAIQAALKNASKEVKEGRQKEIEPKRKRLQQIDVRIRELDKKILAMQPSPNARA
ncbi:hypothetical protein C8J56DRAFT_1161850 [Mycena floridula]|nr:hypothetical protein C8J56DRAFT_1161850 [Mycena floridula]